LSPINCNKFAIFEAFASFEVKSSLFAFKDLTNRHCEVADENADLEICVFLMFSICKKDEVEGFVLLKSVSYLKRH
jgi:hypothetical protein